MAQMSQLGPAKPSKPRSKVCRLKDVALDAGISGLGLWGSGLKSCGWAMLTWDIG